MRDINQGAVFQSAIGVQALVRAIFDEMDAPTRQRIIAKAIGYLPPKPDPKEGRPVDEQLWRGAKADLEALAP